MATDPRFNDAPTPGTPGLDPRFADALPAPGGTGGSQEVPPGGIQDNPSIGQTALGALSNFPGNVASIAKEFASSVNPVPQGPGGFTASPLATTLKTVGGVAQELLNPLQPEKPILGALADKVGTNIQYFAEHPDQIGPSLKVYIRDNPAEALMWLSSLGDAGKALMASKTLNTATDILNPMGMAQKAYDASVGALAHVPLTDPVANMKQVLKLPMAENQLTPVERATIASNFLKYQVPLSTDGYAQVVDHIKDLGDTTKAVIDNATVAGSDKVVDVNRVIKEIQDLRGNPDIALSEHAGDYNKAIDDEVAKYSAAHPTDIPLQEAQLRKQVLYKELGNNYDVSKPEIQVQVEAKKAIARSYAQQIEEQVPQVKALNQEMSNYLQMRPFVAKAAGRLENADPLTPGTLFRSAIAASVSSPSVGGALLFSGMAPKAKLIAAQKIYNASKRPLLSPVTPGLAVAQRVPQYSNQLTGLLSPQQEK